MKRLVLLTSLILLFFIAFPAFAVEHELDFDAGGCQQFDFSLGAGNWTVVSGIGEYISGGFSGTVSAGASYPKSKRVLIQLDIVPVVINSIEIIYDFTKGTWSNSSQWALAVNNAGGSEALVYSPPVETQGHITNGTNKNKLVVYPGDVKEFIRIDLRSSAVNSGTPGGTAVIKSVTVCGDPLPAETILRPLEAQHEDAWGLFHWDDVDEPVDGQNPYTVNAFSTAPGAPVHNVIAGNVLEVKRLSMDLCFDRLTIQQLVSGQDAIMQLACPIGVPPEVHGGGGNTHVYALKRDFSNPFTQLTGLEVYSASVVTVEGEDGAKYEYIISNPQVEEGDTLTEGCVIGYTMRLYSILNTIPLIGQAFSLLADAISFIGNDAGQGYAAVTRLNADNDPVVVLPDMKIYPTANSACGIPSEYKDCVGDSTLIDPEQWTEQGSVTWMNPGVQLGSYSGIRSVYNLSQDRQPKMKVSARSVSGTAEMGLRIGETSQSFTVSTNQYQDYEIPGAAHEPSADLFYDIIISNDSTATLEIQYACITFTLDEEGNPEPPPQPETCYFQNYSFNDGTGSWTVSNPGTGVYTLDTRDGEILVKDNQTFEQTATLHPADESTPQDYVIRVEAAIYHYPSYSLSASNTTSTVEIEYDSGGGYTSLGTYTYADFANADNVILFEDTFTVSAENSDAFVFRVQTVSQPAEVEAISIRLACLDTDTGDDFPGYGGDDDEPDAPPFPEDCDAIERPSGSAVHHWIAWHWANLNGFFQCDLMVFLNTQYKSITNFFKTVTWSIRWGQASIRLGIDWMSAQLLPWIGGYLSNTSGAAVVYYGDGVGEDPDEGCEWWNIICHAGNVADGIGDFLSDAFNTLRDVLGSIFNDFLVPLMEGLFSLLRELVDRIIRPLLEGLMDLLRRIVEFIFTELISFIKKAVNFIFNVLRPIIERILDVARFVINKLIQLLLTVKALLEALINLWNDAEPATLPGIPNCAVSSNNLMCWVYFVFENTFFSGPVGGLIIPLITALAWILLGLSVLGQLLRLVRQAGQAV